MASDVRTRGKGTAGSPLPITAVMTKNTVVELEVVVHMFVQDGTYGQALWLPVRLVSSFGGAAVITIVVQIK